MANNNSKAGIVLPRLTAQHTLGWAIAHSPRLSVQFMSAAKCERSTDMQPTHTMSWWDPVTYTDVLHPRQYTTRDDGYIDLGSGPLLAAEVAADYASGGFSSARRLPYILYKYGKRAYDAYQSTGQMPPPQRGTRKWGKSKFIGQSRTSNRYARAPRRRASYGGYARNRAYPRFYRPRYPYRRRRRWY